MQFKMISIAIVVFFCCTKANAETSVSSTSKACLEKLMGTWIYTDNVRYREGGPISRRVHESPATIRFTKTEAIITLSKRADPILNIIANNNGNNRFPYACRQSFKQTFHVTLPVKRGLSESIILTLKNGLLSYDLNKDRLGCGIGKRREILVKYAKEPTTYK